MAAETATTITLQARDLEIILGVIHSNPVVDVSRFIKSAETLYDVATPPQGTGNVTITTKEKVLVKIASVLHYPHIYNVFQGTNNLSRIMTAIRALNTDGYITTAVDAYESAAVTRRNDEQTVYRKSGRALAMIDVTDNN